jgi:uncharacterized protein YggU (UPF0235/DUF167 family)
VIIHVRVKAAQRSDGLWRDEDVLCAHIRGVPKDGEANKYLEAYLASCFGIANSNVRVVKGLISRHKTVEVTADNLQIRKIITNLPEFPQKSLF